MRQRFGASLLTISLLALMCVERAAGQTLPDYMYPIIKDAGRMSIAAYGKSPELVGQLKKEGWEVLMFASLPGGLHYAIWDRQLPNGKKERFVAFAGTEDG